MVLKGNPFVIVNEATDMLRNKSQDSLEVTWRFDCNRWSLKSPADKLASKFHAQMLEAD